ncbi:S-transferase [Beijerinckiaceae bacterium RH CH11]|nr:S-transferase [Beijerinckiaceae bacterium RH CH11]VVB48235.1 S-transferase [Beijerinckiaceae bacterium RH AL8]
MVDGTWQSTEHAAPTEGGAFVRPATTFREWIGSERFPAEAGRYHLYVSLACPWAHRTLIFRKLQGLEGLVGLSVTHWLMGEDGWTFDPAERVVPDPLGATRLYEIYARADPRYTGRASVPILWDLKTGTIVNNESGDIIRIFNSAFDDLGAAPGDFYPEALRPEIDEINATIYAAVNNGVYRAGFAGSQEAYEAAISTLFETLDRLETRLSRQRYLCGDQVTEADWRLFTTMVRFDAVYNCHFKCNMQRLVDYPALWAYTRSLYQVPGVADTVDFDHIKRHYYMSHPWINPTRLVPTGPVLDFSAPDDRFKEGGNRT